jgi:rhodanese-related sulfurtransferase
MRNLIRRLAPLGLVAIAALACTPSADQRPSIPAASLAALLEEGRAPLVLDVRTPAEYQAGHVPGAVLVPHTELGARLADLGDPGKVIVYCESGRRAAQAIAILRDAGWSPVHLSGDMSGWRAAGLPSETGPPPPS